MKPDPNAISANHDAILSEAPLGAVIAWHDPNSPLARYYLSTSQVLAIVILSVIFVVVGSAPLWHTDVWGHIKFGQWIVQHRALPAYEPNSPYTDKTQPMIHYSWLAQATNYLIF